MMYMYLSNLISQGTNFVPYPTKFNSFLLGISASILYLIVPHSIEGEIQGKGERDLVRGKKETKEMRMCRGFALLLSHSLTLGL